MLDIQGQSRQSAPSHWQFLQQKNPVLCILTLKILVNFFFISSTHIVKLQIFIWRLLCFQIVFSTIFSPQLNQQAITSPPNMSCPMRYSLRRSQSYWLSFSLWNVWTAFHLDGPWIPSPIFAWAQLSDTILLLCFCKKLVLNPKTTLSAPIFHLRRTLLFYYLVELSMFIVIEMVISFLIKYIPWNLNQKLLEGCDISFLYCGISVNISIVSK